MKKLTKIFLFSGLMILAAAFGALCFGASDLITGAFASVADSVSDGINVIAGIGGGGVMAMAVTPRFNPFRVPTPQGKIVSVTDRLGANVKKNQGSTYEVYDYIQVPAATTTESTLIFFDGVNSKAFPFTNIQQNQLQTGEALAIEKIFFVLMILNDAGRIITWAPLVQAMPEANLAQWSLNLDNNRTVKPISIARANTQFNPEGKTGTNYVFFPETNQVIPPQVQFTGNLRLPEYTVTVQTGEVVYIGIHLTGSAAILNIKTDL